MECKIIPENKVNDILKYSEFKEHKRSLEIMPGIVGMLMNNMTLLKLQEINKTWNAKSMAEGYDYLLQLTKQGNVFFDIWSEEDRKADRSKRTTELVAFQQRKKSKFAVICAGGSYMGVVSAQEAFPVAKELHKKGYAVFVLKYRCGKYAVQPNPMEDIAQAVKYIQNHAESLNVIKTDYAVMGFSAGGHLAASFGSSNLGYKKYGISKPGCIILGYPVISMGEKTHKGTRTYVLGKKNQKDEKLIEKYSVEKQVDENYPPVYIWHCENDDTVPAAKSELLVQKLNEYHIPLKHRVYQGTAHGWGLGKGTTAEGWLEEAVEFWEAQTR